MEKPCRTFSVAKALALDVMTQEVQVSSCRVCRVDSQLWLLTLGNPGTWEASPTSPNTPSLGEGTVSELSLESWSCS